uniref:Uncharacterized protein n=2 Tax=Picea TaxID=3328 RepID=A0A101M3J7_PICGL|nr:hypothetical protein ABT39_MTgene132 [Picea glauca]KUM50308.1 hypothetical protein ABT39_MTgene151 [Picea glauca]KUM50313.1 hypothetical protein ABT39_MTgene156 [Picea glauca]QHR91776.1 hypothetical protein Q903MT_gene5812 [Picea sitchensis]
MMLLLVPLMVGLEMGGVMRGNCLPYSIRIAIIYYLPLLLLRFR